MKTIKLFLLLIFTPLCFAGDVNDLIFKNDFELVKKRIFISGHSLMDNPYADYLQSISTDKGLDYNWNQQIGIGSPIRVRTSGATLPDTNLWTGYLTGKNRDTFDMNIISELANPMTIGDGELYDSLVITERHDILDTIMWEYSNSLLRHYHNRLLTGNPHGRTYFYQSWWNIDLSNPQEWIDHTNLEVKAYECIAQKVNLTLANDALPQVISVIPAGTALAYLAQEILNDNVPGFVGTDFEKLDLLFNDNVHLNIEGVFYMSAVTYATLLGKSPVGADIPAGISNDTGQALLQIAWDSVQNYQSNFTAPSMTACRNIIETQLCPSYWSIHDQTENTAFCQAWITDDNFLYNPFHWPDPNLLEWPDP